jgi:lysozyme family protein
MSLETDKKFHQFIGIILKNEGGFQKIPQDWGNWYNGQLIGTKYGIAARYFADKYDIPNLTIEQAKEIYYNSFWSVQKVYLLDKIACDNTLLHLFDFGVNTNPWHANKSLQRIVGANIDGVIGDETKNKTLQYVKKYSKEELLMQYKSERQVWYQYTATKRNNRVFLQGWLDRIEHTKI